MSPTPQLPVMSRAALNRALLARQMLLARETATPATAVSRLVGLQAQLARPPFVGLWSRLQGFERDHLISAVQQRAIVRATLMRSTLHLWTAQDYRQLRGTVQPALTRAMRSTLGKRVAGVDIDDLLEVGRRFFAAGPRPFKALRQALEERFPTGDVRALAYTVRTHLPLVQVPTAAPWAYPGAADFALAEDWLGGPVDLSAPDPRALALRYLAAFGPATPADFQSWSGLTATREVLDGLRPDLVLLQDTRGRVLFDLPGAPRPPGDTPAPARFVAAFDNLVLGHADRERIVSEQHRPRMCTKNLQVPPTILVDGFVAGTWRAERVRRVGTVVVQPFAPLDPAARRGLAEEGEALARFVEPKARSWSVRFEAPG